MEINQYVWNSQTFECETVVFGEVQPYHVVLEYDEWEKLRYMHPLRMGPEGKPIFVEAPQPTIWHKWNVERQEWDSPSDEDKDVVINEGREELVRIVTSMYDELFKLLPDNGANSVAENYGERELSRILKSQEAKDMALFDTMLDKFNLRREDFSAYWEDMGLFEETALALTWWQQLTLARIFWLQSVDEVIEYVTNVHEKLPYVADFNDDPYVCLQNMLADYLEARKEAEEKKPVKPAGGKPQSGKPKNEDKDK